VISSLAVGFHVYFEDFRIQTYNTHFMTSFLQKLSDLTACEQKHKLDVFYVRSHPSPYILECSVTQVVLKVHV